MEKVVVLGGYGNFGKRIVENLAAIEEVCLVIAGRNIDKANDLVHRLESMAKAQLEVWAVDITVDDFTERLKRLSPFLVIHTSGPFQGQSYYVPEACIAAGAHYVDLADDRRFVCDIKSLDEKAKAAGVLLVSGASSVPGLSSAVIDHYKSDFASIDCLDIAIAPGNRAERGEATVRGILSYTGHAFSVFKQGRWQAAYGWMDPRKHDFAGIVGKRWLANVDVPDLELFPERYKVKERVGFQAGLELPFLHLSMVAMAKLAKIGLVKNWAPLVKPIVKASNLLLPFGSDKGAMQVVIKGRGTDGKVKTVKWTLYAPGGVGPYIPTLSTIIVARKLLHEAGCDGGALACVGLFTLNDFRPYFIELGLSTDKVVS